MDFIVGLPRTQVGYDSSQVVLDIFTNFVHFRYIKTSLIPIKLAKIFLKEVVILHGIPSSIVSDKDYKFTSKLWKAFHISLGIHLNLSIVCHSQIERTIHTLKYILRILCQTNAEVEMYIFLYQSFPIKTVTLLAQKWLYTNQCMVTNVAFVLVRSWGQKHLRTPKLYR